MANLQKINIFKFMQIFKSEFFVKIGQKNLSLRKIFLKKNYGEW